MAIQIPAGFPGVSPGVAGGQSFLRALDVPGILSQLNKKNLLNKELELRKEKVERAEKSEAFQRSMALFQSTLRFGDETTQDKAWAAVQSSAKGTPLETPLSKINVFQAKEKKKDIFKNFSKAFTEFQKDGDVQNYSMALGVLGDMTPEGAKLATRQFGAVQKATVQAAKQEQERKAETEIAKKAEELVKRLSLSETDIALIKARPVSERIAAAERRFGVKVGREKEATKRERELTKQIRAEEKEAIKETKKGKKEAASAFRRREKATKTAVTAQSKLINVAARLRSEGTVTDSMIQDQPLLALFKDKKIEGKDLENLLSALQVNLGVVQQGLPENLRRPLFPGVKPLQGAAPQLSFQQRFDKAQRDNPTADETEIFTILKREDERR